jgi:hypothetical protein
VYRQHNPQAVHQSARRRRRGAAALSGRIGNYLAAEIGSASRPAETESESVTLVETGNAIEIGAGIGTGRRIVVGSRKGAGTTGRRGAVAETGAGIMQGSEPDEPFMQVPNQQCLHTLRSNDVMVGRDGDLNTLVPTALDHGGKAQHQ